MNLWDEVLARIETKINRHSFYTWFKPTTFVAEDRCRRSPCGCRMPLFKDWLTKHYSGVIAEAMGELKRAEPVDQFRGRCAGRQSPIPLEPGRSSRRSRPARRRSRPAGAGRPQSPLHLRHLHRRARRISSRTRPAAPSPKRRRAPTTRCSSTAASVSARRI